MVRRLIVSSAIIAAAITSVAQADVSLTFESPSYTAGAVVGQGSPAWEGTNTVLSVADNVGKNGTAGLITQQKGNVTSYPSVWYRPDSTAMGGDFVSGASKISFSFDMQLVASDGTAGELLYRIYIGANSLYGSFKYATLISIYADGKVSATKSGGTVNYTGLLSAGGAFHTLAGTLDYQTGLFSMMVDNNTTTAITDAGFASAYSATDYTTFGGFKFNVAPINTDINRVALDNISFALVPEPAAMGLLGLGALCVLGKKSNIR